MNKYRLRNLPGTSAPVSLNTLALSFEVLEEGLYKGKKIKHKKITSRVDSVDRGRETRQHQIKTTTTCISTWLFGFLWLWANFSPTLLLRLLSRVAKRLWESVDTVQPTTGSFRSLEKQRPPVNKTHASAPHCRYHVNASRRQISRAARASHAAPTARAPTNTCLQRPVLCWGYFLPLIYHQKSEAGPSARRVGAPGEEIRVTKRMREGDLQCHSRTTPTLAPQPFKCSIPNRTVQSVSPLTRMRVKEKW